MPGYNPGGASSGNLGPGGGWAGGGDRGDIGRFDPDALRALESMRQQDQREAAALAAQQAEARTVAAKGYYGDAPPEEMLATEDLGFWDEAKQRGWKETIANHLMGVIPGVDVQAQNYANFPGIPAPSRTTASAARAVGDVFGFPGMGDMLQAGLEGLTEEDYGEYDVDMAGLPSGKTSTLGEQSEARGKGEIFRPRTVEQTVKAQEAENKEKLAAMLMGPGYTRAGQGIIQI